MPSTEALMDWLTLPGTTIAGNYYNMATEWFNNVLKMCWSKVDKCDTCSLFIPQKKTTFHGQHRSFWKAKPNEVFWKGSTISGTDKTPVVKGKRSRQQHLQKFGLQWASRACWLVKELFHTDSEKMVSWDRSTDDPGLISGVDGRTTKGWDYNWVIRPQQGVRVLAPNMQILSKIDSSIYFVKQRKRY